MGTSGAIKVLVVDDSAVIRSILTRALSSAPDIKVVGGAQDPFEARDLIVAFRPDVILLDINMPRMDGLTFLKKLRVHYPVPVIMCSGAAGADSQAALEAIELGAVDFVAKPGGGASALTQFCDDLCEKIRAAAIATTTRPEIRVPAAGPPGSFRAAGLNPASYLIAVGASTGGTEAIKEILSNVPADFPPVAIVQHMPAGFTKSFAERLDRFSAMAVSEAVDGDQLVPGRALLGRGGIQMGVCRTVGGWRVVYGTDELCNRHCPSVDVLFDSVAACAGKQAVGVILTGMGADGAQGLLKMYRSGAVTVAQDQDSCVVYGMPKVAVELGAAQHRAPPALVPGTLTRALQRRDIGSKAKPAGGLNRPVGDFGRPT